MSRPRISPPRRALIVEDHRELSPAASAGAPLPSADPNAKFAPAAAASVVAPETKAMTIPAAQPAQ